EVLLLAVESVDHETAERSVDLQSMRLRRRRDGRLDDGCRARDVPQEQEHIVLGARAASAAAQLGEDGFDRARQYERLIDEMRSQVDERSPADRRGSGDVPCRQSGVKALNPVVEPLDLAQLARRDDLVQRQEVAVPAAV